jgi:hypothetical protein
VLYRNCHQGQIALPYYPKASFNSSVGLAPEQIVWDGDVEDFEMHIKSLYEAESIPTLLFLLGQTMSSLAGAVDDA